jgi:hypothetical protein
MTGLVWLRSARTLRSALALVAGGLSLVAAGCGGDEKPQPQPLPYTVVESFQPKGCGFSVAPRPEYKEYSIGDNDVGATPNIRRVRLGLGGNVSAGAANRADPSTSIAMAWQTDAGTYATQVTWGKTPDPTSWPAENRADGVRFIVPQTETTINGQGDEWLHEAYLCGLEPATTYYYRVGGGPAGKEVWSDVYTFTTTTKDPAAEVKIGFAGDARGQDNQAWRLIQKRYMAAGVNLQVFTGDTIVFAPDQGEWEQWLDLAWKDADGSLLSLGQILTLNAHGNHENHTSLFFGNVVLPQEPASYPKYGELFYSVDVGPVHLMVFDEYAVGSPSTDPDFAAVLEKWLNDDLAAAAKNRANVPWIVASHHHGEFSSASHGTDADVLRIREFLVPLWDKYHVDLVIDGHDHNYERSKPLTGNPGMAPTVKNSFADGTTYVICAGAGADAYGNGTSDFTATSKSYATGGAFGFYSLLTASKTSLTYQAHELRSDASDPVIDEFTIMK